ncbi:hypothetical protein RCOM_0875560 [Ricinus communis]|uniref:Uncharacterized protein n=1 Tax=Ricinus communis TaxID=3988 RepID=B9S6X2_RICCO|nr:hypothetical protein RCOM_0875560 [Ricinus communis]
MSMSSITLLSGFKSAKAMAEALIWFDMFSAELMLLGFISLLITVGTKPISMICIPEKAANIMLPCKEYDKDDDSEKDKDKDKVFHVLCSVITIALAKAKMGSHMKKTIFEEQTATALKKWRKAAKERNRQRKPATEANSCGFMVQRVAQHQVEALHQCICFRSTRTIQQT